MVLNKKQRKTKKNPHMGILLTKSFHFLTLTLVILIAFVTLSSSKSSPDYITLVYKGCANQTLSDQTGVYSSQTLSTLFSSLISQSSKTKFFKTSSSSNGGEISFTGLFQCRGDLNNGDCYNCVSKIPEILDKMCGKTIAGRIQLNRCYILYEVARFPQISGVQMLYKSCSNLQAEGSEFMMRRDTAFSALESGIVSGNRFYTSSYESVYALAQCEGDLSMKDCEECVKTVVQKSQVECGSSISGQIYLHRCYMSYSYYPNGISRKSSSVGKPQNTGKTIAIVVGGAAGLGFVIICLMFAKSLLKKHDSKY